MAKKRRIRIRAKKSQKITPSQWDEIKLRSTRDSTTYSKLANEYGIAEQTIKDRAHKEQWSEDKKVFQHDMTQEMRQLFIEAGLPPSRLVQLITESAQQTHKLQNVKKTIRPKGKKSYNLEETIQVRDNDNTRMYREMVNKMIGAFAPPKAAVKIQNGNENGPKRIEIELIEVHTRKEAESLRQ